jgi:membrane protein YqaA with SNARE-associated domain
MWWMVSLGGVVLFWLGYVTGALMTGSKRADADMLREENRREHLRRLGL